MTNEIDPKVVEELKVKHGDVYILTADEAGVQAVCKRPSRPVYRKFRDQRSDPNLGITGTRPPGDVSGFPVVAIQLAGPTGVVTASWERKPPQARRGMPPSGWQFPRRQAVVRAVR